MPPERADLVLPTNIPYGERDVLVFDGLDVETLFKGRNESILERLSPQKD